MYGWRAKLGVLLPSSGSATEPDFYTLVPKGVTCHFQRFYFPGFSGKGDLEKLQGLESYAADAARLLLDVKPDVVSMCCTAGSFIGGAGYDQMIIKKISERLGGIPTTTVSTSVVKAFSKLGIKKITMATPYPEFVTRTEQKFLEGNDIEVLGLSWLTAEEGGMAGIGHVSYEMIKKLVKKAYRPESDAIFVSCAGLHVIEIIEALEQDWGKPVITSNQAAVWDMLRMANVNEKIEGYGKLLRT